MDSLLADTNLGFPQGVHFYVDWILYCSLIGNARNLIVDSFLRMNQSDTLIMVDADISWKPGELLRLAKKEQHVIGGTYRPKVEQERFHVHGPVSRFDQRFEVGGLPGGFLKISRTALERIKPNLYERDGKVLGDYFPTGAHDGRYYGEDYGFCRLWREAGGTVWLDPSFKLRHHDGGKAYTGDPEVWLTDNQDAINRRYDGRTLAYVADQIRLGLHTDDDLKEAMDLVGNPSHAAPIEFLSEAVRVAKESNLPILEAGSGLSTILMAAASDSVVWTLEDSEGWANQIHNRASRAKVRNIAIVRCVVNSGWYAIEPEDHSVIPPRFSLGVLDGPERPHERHRFLDEFGDRCELILVDDLNLCDIGERCLAWALARGRSFERISDRVGLIT